MSRFYNGEQRRKYKKALNNTKKLNLSKQAKEHIFFIALKIMIEEKKIKRIKKLLFTNDKDDKIIKIKERRIKELKNKLELLFIEYDVKNSSDRLYLKRCGMTHREVMELNNYYDINTILYCEVESALKKYNINI